MCLPSGDQTGQPSSAAHAGMSRPARQRGVKRLRPVPFAFTVQMECTPADGARANTILDPSGDQSGFVSSVPREGCVILVTPVPSALATKISPQAGPSAWRRRSKTMRPFEPGVVAFPIGARTTLASSPTPANSAGRRIPHRPGASRSPRQSPRRSQFRAIGPRDRARTLTPTQRNVGAARMHHFGRLHRAQSHA